MPETLGAFTQDEIASFVHEVKFPENSGTTPTDRFVKQISDLVQVRTKAGEAKGFSVILRSDALDTDVRGRNYPSLPLFRNGLDALSQGIFLSNALLVQAYAVPLNSNNGDIFTEVKNAGYGNLPALVIDWRGDEPKATLFASGVENQDDLQEIYLTETEISASHLREGLEDFYNKRLRTPSLLIQGHSVKVWGEKPSDGWPATRPEERIQGILMTFLMARYSRFSVRAEVNTEDGRLDLKIFAKLLDNTGTKYVKNIWVLELKALTDRTSTGGHVPNSVTEEAIEKGLIQAASYKDSEHVNNAALCCFDMRENDLGDEVTFANIADRAKANGIHLWRWFLHRSTEASRNTKFAARGGAMSSQA